MSERDELADLATIIGEQFEHHPGPACSLCEDINSAAAAVRMMGYRKPRTITTVEELDALPDAVLVLTEQGGYWESIKRMDGKNWWKEPGARNVSPSEDLTLPATVLYEPQP